MPAGGQRDTLRRGIVIPKYNINKSSRYEKRGGMKYTREMQMIII